MMCHYPCSLLFYILLTLSCNTVAKNLYSLVSACYEGGLGYSSEAPWTHTRNSLPTGTSFSLLRRWPRIQQRSALDPDDA